MKTNVNVWAEGGEVKGRRQFSPCLPLLRSTYPSLTDAERRIADFISANPSPVLRLTITEVAEASGVGVSTVTRLATKLGYAGFPEMKTALAVELLNPEYDVPEPIGADDSAHQVVQKITRFGIQHLNNTAALLDPDALTQAATAIVHARRVELYALGALTGAIAQIAHDRLLVLGIPCALLLHYRQSVVSATALGNGDVALALSHSGETDQIVTAANAAAEGGATTICITNTPLSTLARVAQIRLLAAPHETWLWGHHRATSYIAMLSVVDALYALVSLLKYRRT